MRITLTARRPAALLAAGAALALTLTACGGNEGPAAASPPSPTGATVQGVTAARNDADVTFINDMAPHHSGAVAMAQLAATRAGSAQVKDLAERIAAAQGPEIERMKAMAAAWGVTLRTDSPSMPGMSGMGGDIEALTPLTGAVFDREFLNRMIAHHTTAVAMAQAELAQGSNPQAKELATSIVSAQQKEIAEMNDLLKTV